MRLRRIATRFFVAIALMSWAQPRHPGREESSFTESHPFKHPVPVPLSVLNLLSRRPEVKDNLFLHNVRDSKPKNLGRLFTASQIHLGPADEVDLIIMGNEGMGGADNAYFWVVRSAYQNPVIVLWAGADGLDVLMTKTNGYRDIWTGWNSPSEELTELYKFDGGSYKLAKKSRRERRG